MKIAVIGAGLAGVTLARQLEGHADITIFEKSRGVGGRMACRRRDGYVFDHGAQYFTARSEIFRAELVAATARGVAAVWPKEIGELSSIGLAEKRQSSEIRYVGMPGMNGLAAALGHGLDIRLEMQVASIRRLDDRWLLTDDEGGTLGRFDFVVSTAPAPQTAKLMPEVFNGHATLQSVQMSGCFTLMVGCTEDPKLGFEAVKLDHPVLSWMAVNSTKPGRSSPFSLVVHSRNDWAESHIDAPRNAVSDKMLEGVEGLTGHRFADAAWIDLHRWRYANVERAVERPFLLDAESKLAACGDWCLGNRVEAAFESAYRLRQAMRPLVERMMP